MSDDEQQRGKVNNHRDEERLAQMAVAIPFINFGKKMWDGIRIYHDPAASWLPVAMPRKDLALARPNLNDIKEGDRVPGFEAVRMLLHFTQYLMRQSDGAAALHSTYFWSAPLPHVV